MEEKQKETNVQIGYTIPNGYRFIKIEDGKVYIQRIHLPNTWEECIDRLGKTEEGHYKKTSVAEYVDSASNITTMYAHEIKSEKHQRNAVPINLGSPIRALCQLLICREVYRNGWKPDWNSSTPKFCIYLECTHKIKVGQTDNIPHVLSFNSSVVTEKFIKNFKDLILEASELLF